MEGDLIQFDILEKANEILNQTLRQAEAIINSKDSIDVSDWDSNIPLPDSRRLSKAESELKNKNVSSPI